MPDSAHSQEGRHAQKALAAINLFIGRSALRDGLRMLAIGAAAGAPTYTIAKLLGVSLP